jgi:hypothetical protein
VPGDADPNPWSVQRDEAKTLITLGTAVLGVSTTFGKSILAPSGSASLTLLLAWLAIAASIVTAILASATVFSRLKANADIDAGRSAATKKTPGGIASFYLNVSFFLLVGGLVTLAFAAYSDWNTTSSISEAQSITTAEQAAAAAQGTTARELSVQRLSRLSDSEVVVVVVDRSAETTFIVVVDTNDGQITDLSETGWRSGLQLHRSMSVK